MYKSKSFEVLLAILLCITTSSAFAQQAPEPERIGYIPPTKSEWISAGLNMDEYGQALRYQVSLDDWKEMDSSRDTHQTAGWACIALGLLTPAIEATIIWGAGVPLDQHPNQEVFIMVTVAAFASVLTGIVVLASTPGPEDFKQRWKKELSSAVYFAPAPNGFGMGFRF